MIKINRKLTLLLVFMMIIGVLAGCVSKSNAPEGIGQDFYRDMIGSLNKLAKYKGDDSKNGFDIIEKYKENDIWLQPREKETIKEMKDVYFWVWMNSEEHLKNEKNKMIAREHLMTIEKLLEIDIDLSKYIDK